MIPVPGTWTQFHPLQAVPAGQLQPGISTCWFEEHDAVGLGNLAGRRLLGGTEILEEGFRSSRLYEVLLSLDGSNSRRVPEYLSAPVSLPPPGALHSTTLRCLNV